MRTKRIRKAKIKRYSKMIILIIGLILIIGGSERVKQHTDKIIYQRQYIADTMPKAPIITKEEVNYTNEREMLARLLYTEARGESIECQRAVVSVVLNRVNTSGNTISEVIKAPGQFDLGNKLDNIKPLQTQYEVVDYVLTNGITIPEDVTYFRSGHFHSFAEDYKQIGNMYFSR
jgi:hypothetical protein